LPGQLLLLSAGQLPFAFSELGDKVFLLQISGTDVIRFLDSVDFPAVEREESLGLFERSDGALDFTELRANTPGSANDLPRVGPVVISEIMFNPSAGHAEFIELANITPVPVPLYDPGQPTNVWRLEGVGSFAFPENTVLAPCSVLLVCATNPAAFRAQYGLPSSVPVFGPWSGGLDDDGEALKLLRPGAPEPDGTVPNYRVDHVTYRTNAPWPETGIGVGLERIPLEAYGNDPASWRATPVNGTPGTPAGNRQPVISVAGNPVVPQQMPLTLTVSVADLDVPWQSVTLTSTQLPQGSLFDPVHGTLSWTPAAAQEPGEYLVQFTALDSAACASPPVTLQLAIQVTQSLEVAVEYFAEGLQVSYPALPGETCILEFCTDVGLADWQPVQATGLVIGNTVIYSGLAIARNGAGYYRVRWVR
jgi:hypothetical protein